MVCWCPKTRWMKIFCRKLVTFQLEYVQRILIQCEFLFHIYCWLVCWWQVAPAAKSPWVQLIEALFPKGRGQKIVDQNPPISRKNGRIIPKTIAVAIFQNGQEKRTTTPMLAKPTPIKCLPRVEPSQKTISAVLFRPKGTWKRAILFPAKEEAETKMPMTIIFSASGTRKGLKSSTDHFASPRRNSNLRRNKDAFSSRVAGSSVGPADDCFSNKVRSHKGHGLGKDPFAKRTGSRFKGSHGDAFSMKVSGRRSYKLGDGFSSSTAKPSLKMNDHFSGSPTSSGRGSFRGTWHRILFFKVLKPVKRKDRYKQKDSFVLSRKARKKMKEGSVGAPQLDLFKREVRRKARL